MTWHHEPALTTDATVDVLKKDAEDEGDGREDG